MARALRIAVVGAGLVGRRHVAAIRACDRVTLAAIADPAPGAAEFAAALDVAHHETLDDLLARGPSLDGVVLATPNALHAAGVGACIGAGIPVLVEKPFVTDVAEGAALVARAERAGVPLLVGHHRRHSAAFLAAHRTVESGALGRIVAARTTTWLTKPDGYFEEAWRREEGAGPVRVNLVHDVDILRGLVGDVVEVHAFEASGRDHAVEDAAVAVLRFENGALATMSVSDNVAAPCSWELTAREDPAFPPTGATYAWIGGTHGSLELPSAALWSFPGERSWKQPIARTHPTWAADDPLGNQIANFAAVIAGEAGPVVTGRDGLAAVAIVEAVKRSARSGRTQRPSA